MLTSCMLCGQVVEISCLHEHLSGECEKSEKWMQKNRGQLQRLCPLCHEVVALSMRLDGNDTSCKALVTQQILDKHEVKKKNNSLFRVSMKRKNLGLTAASLTTPTGSAHSAAPTYMLVDDVKNSVALLHDKIVEHSKGNSQGDEDISAEESLSLLLKRLKKRGFKSSSFYDMMSQRCERRNTRSGDYYPVGTMQRILQVTIMATGDVSRGCLGYGSR